MSDIQLSVVVPVFNESENLEPLLTEIVAALEGKYAYEIVYVDDSSDDDTAQKLVALKAKFPRLHPVRNNPRSGQSFAVHSGVKVAKGVWIGTLDSDGQNDPADLPKLFDAALQGGAELALVGGVRTKRKDTFSKRIGSKIGNGIRQFFLQDGCPDTGCGIKVFRRDVYLDMPAFNGQHRYLPALFQSRNWKTAFVSVNHRPRERGVSKYNNLQRALVGIRDLIGVAWLRSRARAPRISELE